MRALGGARQRRSATGVCDQCVSIATSDRRRLSLTCPLTIVRCCQHCQVEHHRQCCCCCCCCCWPGRPWRSDCRHRRRRSAFGGLVGACGQGDRSCVNIVGYFVCIGNLFSIFLKKNLFQYIYIFFFIVRLSLLSCMNIFPLSLCAPPLLPISFAVSFFFRFTAAHPAASPCRRAQTAAAARGERQSAAPSPAPSGADR